MPPRSAQPPTGLEWAGKLQPFRLHAGGLWDGPELSQSGAFHFGQFDTVTVEIVQHFPPHPLRIWTEASKLEWLLGSSRKMYSLLKQRG